MSTGGYITDGSMSGRLALDTVRPRPGGSVAGKRLERAADDTGVGGGGWGAVAAYNPGTIPVKDPGAPGAEAGRPVTPGIPDNSAAGDGMGNPAGPGLLPVA